MPVDPNAPVFEPGDKVVVKRRELWTAYTGAIEHTEGGMCRVKIRCGNSTVFPADIPAAELKKL